MIYNFLNLIFPLFLGVVTIEDYLYSEDLHKNEYPDDDVVDKVKFLFFFIASKNILSMCVCGEGREGDGIKIALSSALFE